MADRPQRILQSDEVGVGHLERRRVEHAGRVVVRVEPRLDVGGEGVELVEPGHDRRDEIDSRRERQHTWEAPQERIDRPCSRHDRGDVRAPGQRLVETADDVGGVGSRPGRRTTDDTHDSTHETRG